MIYVFLSLDFTLNLYSYLIKGNYIFYQIKTLRKIRQNNSKFMKILFSENKSKKFPAFPSLDHRKQYRNVDYYAYTKRSFYSFNKLLNLSNYLVFLQNFINIFLSNWGPETCIIFDQFIALKEVLQIS